MLACNNCGTEVADQNALSTPGGEILCPECYGDVPAKVKPVDPALVAAWLIDNGITGLDGFTNGVVDAIEEIYGLETLIAKEFNKLGGSTS